MYRSAWNPAFEGKRQQDAHEALTTLLQCCDDCDMQRLKKIIGFGTESVVLTALQRTTPFYRIFGGAHLCTLKCSSCKHSSDTQQPFAVLNLALRKDGARNLQELIIEHHGEEALPDRRCESCQKVGTSETTTRVTRWPQVLTVSLKRWVPLEGVGAYDKNDDHVSFESEFLPACDVHYQLRGVVVHLANAGSGHYTAFARGPSESFWYNFDVEEGPRLVQWSRVSCAKAYVLVYDR